MFHLIAADPDLGTSFTQVLTTCSAFIAAVVSFVGLVRGLMNAAHLRRQDAMLADVHSLVDGQNSVLAEHNEKLTAKLAEAVHSAATLASRKVLDDYIAGQELAAARAAPAEPPRG